MSCPDVVGVRLFVGCDVHHVYLVGELHIVHLCEYTCTYPLIENGAFFYTNLKQKKGEEQWMFSSKGGHQEGTSMSYSDRRGRLEFRRIPNKLRCRTYQSYRWMSRRPIFHHLSTAVLQ